MDTDALTKLGLAVAAAGGLGMGGLGMQEASTAASEVQLVQVAFREQIADLEEEVQHQREFVALQAVDWIARIARLEEQVRCLKESSCGP